MEMEYEMGKNYSIGEEQKKQFQKLFSHGRLNTIIDNEELILEDNLITEDQLVMADKMRWQFVYLRQMRTTLFEEKYYDN